MPPPIIIADSDDEEEGYSPTRPHTVTRREPGQWATDLVEGDDHSISTDPSFFQNVYDEHNGITQENTFEEVLQLAGRDMLTSSEMTAPAPFQRTVKGFVDLPPPTSISDPTNTAHPTVSAGNEEWTQVSTPGRRKAPTAVMDDPWGVPDSPELKPVRPKIRLKRKEAQSTSAKAAKQNVSGLQEDGFVARQVDHTINPGQTPPTGTAKRRRIETSHLTQASSDDVDLVSLPFGTQPGDTQTSMLPPTLPVGDDPSFWISTKPLTEMQKREYQSIQLSSSNGQQQGYLPSTLPKDVPVIDCSGTSTNVNTPRSDGIWFSTAPAPSIATNSAEEEVAQPTPQQRDSSPDIISLVESPIKPRPTKQRGRPRRDRSRSLATAKIPSEDVHVEEAVPQLMDPDHLDGDADYVEQVVKPKKSRGRPRKKDTAEAVQPPKKLPMPTAEDGKASTKSKKKRGRPKKQGTAPPLEESPPVPMSLSDDIKAVVDETTESTAKLKMSSGEYDTSPEKNTKEESVEEESPTIDPRRGGKNSVLKEMSPNSTVSKSVGEDQEEDEKLKDAQIPRAEKEEKASPAMTKKVGQAKGLSAIINKPMYRVGLSKKSRIAPLLKSLPK